MAIINGQDINIKQAKCELDSASPTKGSVLPKYIYVY